MTTAKFFTISICLMLIGCGSVRIVQRSGTELKINGAPYVVDREIDGLQVYIPLHDVPLNVFYIDEKYQSFKKEQSRNEYSNIARKMDERGQELRQRVNELWSAASKTDYIHDGRVTSIPLGDGRSSVTSRFFYNGDCEIARLDSDKFSSSRLSSAASCIDLLEKIVHLEQKKIEEKKQAEIQEQAEKRSILTSGLGVYVLDREASLKYRNFYSGGFSSVDETRLIVKFSHASGSYLKIKAPVMNATRMAIKDYKVQCDIAADSGTVLQSVQFTIYDVIKSATYKDFSYEFTSNLSQLNNFGKAICKVIGWKNAD